MSNILNTSNNSNNSNILNASNIAEFSNEHSKIYSNLAFVFPGQGSQSLGMLTPFLGQSHKIVENTFQEANDILGYDLFNLMQNGPESDLNLTTHTQVAILATSVAIWRVWQHHCKEEKGYVITPKFMAGHSLGEYSALCAAGYLSFANTLQLVKFRAESMQSAVPVGVGAMAAILGLDDDIVKHICQDITKNNENHSEVVEAVNFNTAGQVVIAGHQKAVESAIDALKAAGAKRALLLNVSAPFHTSLMQKVADALLLKLNDLNLELTLIDIVQNINAGVAADSPTFKKQLAQQAASPVLWSQSIEFLKQQGVTHMIECGTGKILQGLNKRVEGIHTDALFSHEELIRVIVTTNL
jgi:[acyl-carrier-protein] S-malonyltransferase